MISTPRTIWLERERICCRECDHMAKPPSVGFGPCVTVCERCGSDNIEILFTARPAMWERRN